MDNGKIGGVRTPNPLNRLTAKFGMGDYVGDITPHTKTQSNRPSGGVTARG